MTLHVGVDGCPAGWFATWLDSQAGGLPVLRCKIVQNIADILAMHPSATRVLVDMPIGLLKDETRAIEAEVRKLVGPRRSSVFSVPCFDAVYADSYELANQTNRAHIGKGLSKQAWFLCPKIRDVNDVLSRDQRAREVIGECHPELAFATFKQAHLSHAKKTLRGIEQRKHILRALLPDVESFITECLRNYKRKELVLDDCLDALVLLATARHPKILSAPKQKGEGDIDIKMWVPDGIRST